MLPISFVVMSKAVWYFAFNIVIVLCVQLLNHTFIIHAVVYFKNVAYCWACAVYRTINTLNYLNSLLFVLRFSRCISFQSSFTKMSTSDIQ